MKQIVKMFLTTPKKEIDESKVDEMIIGHLLPRINNSTACNFQEILGTGVPGAIEYDNVAPRIKDYLASFELKSEDAGVPPVETPRDTTTTPESTVTPDTMTASGSPPDIDVDDAWTSNQTLKTMPSESTPSSTPNQNESRQRLPLATPGLSPVRRQDPQVERVLRYDDTFEEFDEVAQSIESNVLDNKYKSEYEQVYEDLQTATKEPYRVATEMNVTIMEEWNKWKASRERAITSLYQKISDVFNKKAGEKTKFERAVGIL
ncbi:hypothetical protein KDA14_05895, partial [Candidatus Saccharibacteria bacterium]|nr:hypothetical protein [Candidatus Saccharibacteria bacterium]